MAPTDNPLSKRWYHCYSWDNNCNSDWHGWGRWVLLAVIIIVFIAAMASFSISARRRRRRGMQPFYGTGWMANSQKYGPNQQYPMNNYNQQGYPPQQGGYGAPPNEYGYYNPPPAYPQHQQSGAQPGGNYPVDAGYYGGQNQTGAPPPQDSGLQSPPNAYQREDPYAPPPGPPPGKY